MTATVPSSEPLLDETAASHAYRGHADRYDQRTRTFQHWREQLVARLPVGSGDTVLDVGCGTGLCMPGLQDKIGPGGRIIGIDASPDMLALAAKRVTESGWRNVHLINAPVGEADIDGAADAALFCAVHDVMQSPEAIANVFAHLRPGAAVAAIGGRGPLRGCGPCGNGSPTCTPRSSPISPASTSPGVCSPTMFPTCRSANSAAAPVTSPSAIPRAATRRGVAANDRSGHRDRSVGTRRTIASP